MSANFAAQAGEAQIKLFEFESNYNKPVDVSGGILELNYYESILDNSIRATATFADTGYRNGEGSAIVEEGDLNLTVGEKVNLKVNDGNQFELNFTGAKQLRIKETRNIDESTNKIIFTVDLFSKESINNELEQCRVKQRFDGKISDSVEKILKEILKTEKELDIDTTLNQLSFIGNVEKPFYKCTWLGPRSVPDVQNAKGNLSGYFFYETYEGFKFKSIDKLFEQNPKRKLIFNNIIGEIPPGYDGKILDYSFDSTIDLKTSLLTGSLFNSKLKGVNAFESSYRENQFDHKNQGLTNNIGGIDFPLVASDLKIQEQVTRILYKWDDPGFLVEGKDLISQLLKSTYTNYNNDEILRQSYVRYNNLFNIKLSIAISGDMSLRAGDLLHCDFPEVTSNTTKSYSKKKSGIYMISDVCHRITKNGCYTRLNLVRDSIGRKPSK
jgi:hypothetical protein